MGLRADTPPRNGCCGVTKSYGGGDGGGGGGGGGGDCDPLFDECGWSWPDDPELGWPGAAPGDSASDNGPLHLEPNWGKDPGSFGESLGFPAAQPRGSWGIAAALGLPGGPGCEFGACGTGGLGFGQNPQGVPNNITITIPPNVWWWATHGNHKAVGGPPWHGNWCGVGGSGIPTDDADVSCLIHDYCYTTNGLNAIDNWLTLPAGKAAAIKRCNQQLCDNEWFSGGTIPSATIEVYFNFYAIVGGRYGCNGRGPGY